jgi:hypothetical protein
MLDRRYGFPRVWTPWTYRWQDIHYTGKHSAGRWIDYTTDTLVERPKWAKLKWLTVVDKILPRRWGRGHRIFRVIDSDRSIHKVAGPIRKPGLYLGYEITLDQTALLPELLAWHKDWFKTRYGCDLPPDEETQYIDKLMSGMRDSPRFIIRNPRARRKYTRSPKGTWMIPLAADKTDGKGRISPRYTAQRATVERWRITDKPMSIEGNGEFKYVRPTNFKAGQRGHDEGNTWCHTPTHECEFTDPMPFVDKLRDYLDRNGWGHLKIAWCQRRYLYYTSDGSVEKQAGILVDADGNKRLYGQRPLLYEGECWALQFLSPEDDMVLTPGILFVDDDMTFITTYQCLRVGQTLHEYNRGINLYAPAEAPMTLDEYLCGPLTDYWERRQGLKALNPNMEIVKPKLIKSAKQVQTEALQTLKKAGLIPEEIVDSLVIAVPSTENSPYVAVPTSNSAVWKCAWCGVVLNSPYLQGDHVFCGWHCSNKYYGTGDTGLNYKGSDPSSLAHGAYASEEQE